MIPARRNGVPARSDSPGPDIRAGYRDFAGFRTRVLEVGPGTSGLPSASSRLVLLHGYCDSADTWRPVLGHVAAAGYSAIAVDLPGFGEADPLRPGAMLPQLDTFAAALIAEQAAFGDIVLAGNSLGGTMGLRAAADPAVTVSGIVSIAAPGFEDSWLVRTVTRDSLALRLWTSLPMPIPSFVVRAIAEQVVPRMLYADAHAAEAEHVRRFVELFPDYRSATTRLHEARRLVAELADAYELERVRSPLLVVACGKDRLVTAAAGRYLHERVPHSRLLMRPDWGHCPQLDDPAAVAHVLTCFAERVARGTAADAPAHLAPRQRLPRQAGGGHDAAPRPAGGPATRSGPPRVLFPRSS